MFIPVHPDPKLPEVFLVAFCTRPPGELPSEVDEGGDLQPEEHEEDDERGERGGLVVHHHTLTDPGGSG